jgi:hypothetical protein
VCSSKIVLVVTCKGQFALSFDQMQSHVPEPCSMIAGTATRLDQDTGDCFTHKKQLLVTACRWHLWPRFLSLNALGVIESFYIAGRFSALANCHDGMCRHRPVGVHPELQRNWLAIPV